MTAWNSLTDLLVAGKKRERELDVEKEAEHSGWAAELRSEIQVFVKRANDLDLEDAGDREELFSLISKSAGRLSTLREDSEASAAPTEALIKLEELIERMENTSTPISVGVISLDSSPRKRLERKRREEKRERKQIKRVREEREEIADHIEKLFEAFE